MAADLFRVVRTLTVADGEQTLASGPVDRVTAMARFDQMAIGWRMGRVRVVREQDYQAGGSR